MAEDALTIDPAAAMLLEVRGGDLKARRDRALLVALAGRAASGRTCCHRRRARRVLQRGPAAYDSAVKDLRGRSLSRFAVSCVPNRSLCAVRALKAWLDASAIEDGSIPGHSRFSAKCSITPSTAARSQTSSRHSHVRRISPAISAGIPCAPASSRLRPRRNAAWTLRVPRATSRFRTHGLVRHSWASLTIPRPVRVEKIVEIGKEVIVDPTDTDEGLTAEMLSATEALEYVNPDEEIAALRAQVRRVGIRAVAESAALSRRHVQEFANGQTKPRSGTIDKLKKALRRLHGFL